MSTWVFSGFLKQKLDFFGKNIDSRQKKTRILESDPLITQMEVTIHPWKVT